MTSWRDRQLAGILVSANEAVEMPRKAQEFSIHQWLISADIDFMERVHGANSRLHDFVMIVDDEGKQLGLPWNPRAQFLSGYPIQAPIVGNALFFSEAYTDEGMDIVSLGAPAERWLADAARALEYQAWLKSDEVRGYAMEYRMRYPQR